MKSNRRQFFQVSLALGMILAVVAQAKTDQPNILWICTDQQRWDTIHALGNDHIHTPNLDRLVKEGVAFTQAYCNAPICTPSRASFLTGMYPSTVQGCKNGAAFWPEQAPLVTKLLKDKGYICGLSGKLHLSTAMANNPEKRPEDDGYTAYHFSHAPFQGGDKNDYLSWLKDKGYTYKQIKALPWKQQVPLHQTTWCCDKAIAFVEKNKGTPWVFSVNIFDPHGPLDPPKDFTERYDIDKIPAALWKDSDLAQKAVFNDIMFQTKVRKPNLKKDQIAKAKYWATIEIIDENVGRLMKSLEDSGQADNTVIIFTSDHGEMLGDHGLWWKGCRFYEGLMRVPLIFWAPKRFKQNLRSNALVDLMDIAPTLMELTGETVPERMQGKSLIPILTGKAAPDFHKDYIRSEYYACLGPATGSKGWPENRATMIRTDHFKLVVYHDHEKGELFDMKNDPNEFTNLWDNPKFNKVRFMLMKKCFDSTVQSINAGPERIGRY
jgi:arylsulfatase